MWSVRLSVVLVRTFMMGQMKRLGGEELAQVAVSLALSAASFCFSRTGRTLSFKSGLSLLQSSYSSDRELPIP